MKTIYKITSLFVVALFIITPIHYSSAQQSREERPDRSNQSVRELREVRQQGSSARVENEIVVKFKDRRNFERIDVESGETVDEAIARYGNQANVESAEPNYIAYATYIPNDSYYSLQWNFDNDTSGGIDMEEAWDINKGNGAVVAIIDTGVAYENYRQGWWTRYYQAPDLENTTFVQGYDFVNNDTHPNDDEGHGTHVAGTIAQSTNNGSGAAGIAFNAKIMPIKVLNGSGSGTYADIAEGIKFAADNGADVINMSLGGGSGASYLEEALEYAYNKGVTIVAAAGNDGNGTVSYPAAYNEYVIAVGATRYDENLASYSNYGSDLDIVAPGGDIGVDQNDDGYGDGILQQTFGNRYNDWGYYFYQGTSMAAPHVAGVAALLISNGTASSPSEVREALESTAKDLGSSGRDNTYGHGLIDAHAALLWGATPPEPVDEFPEVSVTSPSDNDVTNGTITITANASDDDSVDQVNFYIDGDLLSTDISSPYEAEWDSSSVSDGSHTIGAEAVDNANQKSASEITVTTENVNESPTITSPPSTSATANSPYEYQVTSTDPDTGDEVTYHLSAAPSGMTMDFNSGLIMWTPTEAQIGPNAVSVVATDTASSTDTQSFSIEVDPEPEEPEPPVEQTVFNDSFESGLGNWNQDSQNDWRRSSQRSTDGNYSAELDGRATNATLTSLPIDLNGNTDATVTFSWLIEKRLDRNEFINFSISTDGGNTWIEKSRLKGNVDKEDFWHNETIVLNGINNLQLRFGGTMSSRSEDANVDSVTVVSY